MKDAQINLHSLDAHGNRDLSCARLALIVATLSKTLRSNPQKTARLEIIDNFLPSEKRVWCIETSENLKQAKTKKRVYCTSSA